jgi:hypothetical protein
MSYNFLRDAKYIKNSCLCRYDTLDGYSSNFEVNGDVDGWNIYKNIYFYGCWNGVLFGTSYEKECYVSRSNVFLSLSADEFYYIKLAMKITANSTKEGPTTGRIQWTRSDDHVWDTYKLLDFDLIIDDEWHSYTINMGPSKSWQGSIDNLRIYPFIDGWSEDQFAIKSIRMSSLDSWRCSNTQCSYYSSYSHPCPGSGKKASCEAGITKDKYTTISGVSDELIVNIDGYGDEFFSLGNNLNLSGIEMARIIANKLSISSIGGYAFSEVEYSEADKIKIISGNVGSTSSVIIKYSEAAKELGFYNDEEEDISTYEGGEDPADGFDYASSKRLRSFEINRLIDGNKDVYAYKHNPEKYNVEGGRRDFNKVGSHLISEPLRDSYYDSWDNTKKTIIDLSHPINNSGKLTSIYFYGKATNNSKVKICRRKKNGNIEIIHSLEVDDEDATKLYTATPTNYKIDCNIVVSKGDLIGIYDADLYVGFALTTELPDVTFYQINGDISGEFDPGIPYCFGVAGFAIYANSGRYQNNVILDIDFGDRINIEKVNIFGEEEEGYFEFNIASCLDLQWDVNLFGLSHYHWGYYISTGDYWSDIHQNIAYGEQCLADGIITADNGKAGDLYGTGSDGLWTDGGESYFYVNGDAEWLYSRTCDGKHEYCGNKCAVGTGGFTSDPIAFTLYAPNNKKVRIHKSIMYFKEENNFRKLALSSYLGPYDSTGNADDVHFKLIPSYNSIALDGSYHDSTDDDVKEYLFKNPTNPDLIIISGKASNWDEHVQSHNIDWTVIEHNFDEVECYGFRIYTNLHYSTKIIELEVYSKVPINASLVDNVTLSFSDYNEIWKSVEFGETSPNEISAFIGGAPRYIQLTMESAVPFYVNEIEFLVGDDLKLENCEDSVLLKNSKTNAVNESMPLVLENIYDKAFDLFVDIPKETYDNEDLLFWSKLHSIDDVDNPQVGPGCLLYKSEDYEIRNDNGQCAINVLCYGLKNLVDGKDSYEMKDLDHWEFFKTLSSGVSVDYYNKDMDYKDTIITFDPVSSKYWKFVNNYGFINIDDISVYNGDTKLDIDYVFIGSKNGSASQDHLTEHNSGVSIQGGIIRNDVTNEWVISDPDNWYAYSTGDTNVDWELTGSHLYVLDFGDDAGGGPAIEYEFDSMTDFTIDLGLIIRRHSTYCMSHVKVYLFDDIDNEILQLHMRNVWASKLDHEYTRLYSEELVVWGEVDIQDYMYHDDDHINILRLKRSGSNLLFKMNDTTLYNSTFSSTSVSKIRLCMERDNASYCPPIKGAFYFGSYETMGFGFTSSQPIDNIRLRHATLLSPPFEIWISPNNADNYAQFADSTIYIWNDYDKSEDIVISNQALTATNNRTTNWEWVKSYWSKSSGKWYWEIAIEGPGGGQRFMVGVGDEDAYNYPGYTAGGYGYHGYYGSKYHDGSSASYGDTYSVGDIIGTALDLDNGKIWWSKNGVWQDSGVPASGANPAFTGVSGTFYAMGSIYIIDYSITANFGATSFTYAIPDGFSAVYVATSVSVIKFDQLNENHYNYLAIDLEKRHNLSIIRNYGDDADKLLLSTTLDLIDYSNTNTSNVDNVLWGNSDYGDVRWIRIELLSGDGTTRCLRKLGIYPDISTAYCAGGGYNCEWQYLGNILSDYTPSINVAYGAVVTGTNYYFDRSYPSNAIDGVYDNYTVEACWGFQQIDGVDPYLEIDFGALYKISKIKLYHGFYLDGGAYMNKDYFFSVSTCASGSSFTTVLSITNNDDAEVIHQFDPVYARRARLTVTSYDSERYLVYDYDTETYEEFKGSFLREIEVYTHVDIGYIDSESWPIVCMNLKDQFEITDHDLINKNISDTDTDWDNDEAFFRYSDNIWDDPEKVAFTRSGDYVIVYSSSSTTNNYRGYWEYVFDENVYFEEGRYYIEWESMYAQNENEISLTLEGPYIINHFADVMPTTWADQAGSIDIEKSGFYTIKGKQHIDLDFNWGIRYPSIYRSYGLTKWVAVTRDTAENYSYDDDSDKYGKDYLSLFKVYGSEKYNPLEYSWWWASDISQLSNDSIITKVGNSSLKISYPTSSGIDEISFIEGDNFGIDEYWSIKDSLVFWWYIDNINKLDVEFGTITFGRVYTADPTYYSWNIESLCLNSGWNYIKLKFDNYDSIYPEADMATMGGFIDSGLDFKNSEKDMTSFRLRFRGKGIAFTMNIDNLKIERNKFDDEVKFGKGLCLTGYDSLVIPLAGLTLEKGTIEFWLKSYYNNYGNDRFFNIHSRTFFTLTNNNNDIISFGLKSGNWYEPIVGNVKKVQKFNIDTNNLSSDALFSIDDVIHLGFVWTNDGSFTDNGDTFRLYINNELFVSSKFSWLIEDSKGINLKFGGYNTQLSHYSDFDGSGIFENIKIYNYCKTEFDIGMEGITKDITYGPNEFIEVSYDNSNFYGIGSSELPLEFLQVPSGAKRTIYIRSNKNDNFKQSKNTANLIVEWLTTV